MNAPHKEVVQADPLWVPLKPQAGYIAISFTSPSYYVLRHIVSGLCGVFDSVTEKFLLSPHFDSIHRVASLWMVRSGALQGAYRVGTQEEVIPCVFRDIVYVPGENGGKSVYRCTQEFVQQ